VAEKLIFTAEQAREATEGVLLYGLKDTRFTGVSIDSRSTCKDDLFIAIVGAAHDGHRHAADAVAVGQKGVIINRSSAIDLPHDKWRQEGYFCIAVGDTTKALGDLAAFNRRRAGLPVIAITGSNGKTSTRRMTTEVMTQKYSVLAPKGNFNNEIGLPLTLLECRPEHTLAVLELGMNHFGEIRRLSQICSPDIGLITNVGPAHLEGLGSLEGVARAKGELLEYIRPDGAVILNQEDPHLRRLGEKCDHHRVLFFGFSSAADVGAEDIDFALDHSAFTLRLPEIRIRAKIYVPGQFMVANALAAAAGGYLMGLSPEQIRAWMAYFRPRKGRLDIMTTTKGINLIDDTYNANPASMAAALDLLAQVKGKAKAFFVCGDMFELGGQAEVLHQKLGADAHHAGVDRLYATGRFASHVAKGARQEGMTAERILTGSKADIISALALQLRPRDWVLVKGSRAMAMETISEAIKKIDDITNT